MRDGFIKVAAGTPEIKVADCRYNAEQIFTLMRQAANQGVRILVLPELCITGSTCGDLFLQDTLLKGADDALTTILDATKNLDMLTAVGLPVRAMGKVYNCAAVIHSGRLLGLVPKAHLPAQQLRWFTPAGAEPAPVCIAGMQTTMFSRLLFPCTSLDNLTVGVTLGDDPFRMDSVSQTLAPEGACVLLNLSALPETAGLAERRRIALTECSSRLCCALIFACSGDGESTTDAVYAGHNLIAEHGSLLAERRFACGLTTSEIDVDALAYERRHTDFPSAAEDTCLRQLFHLERSTTTLTRPISPSPFVPADDEQRSARCDDILRIAALGLKKRLEHTGAKTAVVGLSGGLDSTLAILITTLAVKLLGRNTEDVIAVTMPCFGTTDRTRDNAVELAQRLGCTLKRIDISAAVSQHFADIGQRVDNYDVTFENAQARERTQVLMDIANQTGGLVIGTGDLSELALGWATYNGDHMSMYGVNSSIPKTLVRHLVSHICGDKKITDPALAHVLADILDTPVSPELLPAVDGRISQITEDLVGPYELHDFFLYYAVRWAFPPKKVLRLAEHAFGRTYDRATILKWETNFYRRFFSQQFKRSCLPDGPMVGSVNLSPRGSWVMPSDAMAKLWLDELEGLGQ